MTTLYHAAGATGYLGPPIPKETLKHFLHQDVGNHIDLQTLFQTLNPETPKQLSTEGRSSSPRTGSISRIPASEADSGGLRLRGLESLGLRGEGRTFQRRRETRQIVS